MPIVTMQVKLRELGRVRMGERGEKNEPKRLDTWRFTSASKSLVESAAAAYGGTPRPWEAPEGKQWEVVSDRDTIPIVLPPIDYLDQWYELWSAGGCQRRCDGATEILQMRPCPCQKAIDAGDADERECKPHTRLWVMLPDLQGVGTWRLETQGFFAAEEMSGVASLLHAAVMKKINIPAMLRIEQRRRKSPGERTKRFAVPVIDIEQQLGETLALGASLSQDALEQPKVEKPLPGRRGTQRVPLPEGTTPPKNPRRPAVQPPQLPRAQLPTARPPGGPDDPGHPPPPPPPTVSVEREAQQMAVHAVHRLLGQDNERIRRWLTTQFPELAQKRIEEGDQSFTTEDWNDIRVLAEEQLAPEIDEEGVVDA